MRTLFRAVLPLLLSAAVFAADRPYLTITSPTVKEVAAGFRTPPPETGMVLWWGMDGPVNEAVVKRDLDTFKQLGFTSVMMEAGYDMSAPYLSPGWFELVKLVVAQAKARGMRVWVEDEGKYPSGFAGGKFSKERPDLRMQALVSERVPVAPGETISRKLVPETVGALAVNLGDNTRQVLDVKSGELRWTAPQGKWEIRLVRHDFRTSPTRAVSHPTRGKDTTNSLHDFMNPVAVQQFIDWTHEQYKKAIGDEFGHTFLGFMGDEPDYSIQGLPWTPAFWTEFEKRKKYDVRPYVPSFFAPTLTDEARRVKADYQDVFSDLISENFFKMQADWCAKNNLQYKVHLNNEHNMMSLIRGEGDYFKDMRYVQVPGIDTIWNQIWPGNISDFPKYASSVAHVYGKPRAFTESFAAYNTPPNLQQAKWVIDYQLARGINLIQIMFFSATANGPRPPRGFMGDPGFPEVARYTTRASYLLSMGRPATQIGLYHPSLTMFMDSGEANKAALAVAQKLLESQRDFDFVDDFALGSVLTLQRGSLRSLSGNEYGTILVPATDVISKTALDRLRAFAKSGGKVVFLGRLPSLVTEASFLKAGQTGDFSWAVVEPTLDLTPKVIAALPPADVAFDQPAAPLKYAHRRWRDADLYFFHNESDQPQARKAVLAGSGKVEVWDPTAGVVSPLAGAAAVKGGVTVPLELRPWESKFIVIGTAAPKLLATALGEQALRFDLNPGKPVPGFQKVLPSTMYSEETGYGFEDAAK